MKHRSMLFGCLFILALAVVYLQPVFYQHASDTPFVSENPVKAPTTMNYETIKADGLANAIGEPVSDFEEDYGLPVRTYRTGYDFEVRVYNQLDDQQYIEINTDGESVQAIKVIGEGGSSLTPFTMGMTMAELTDLTMIYPNFSLKQNDRTVSFELMESDMNYRPLVAFDNGTFAVLFFDHITAKLQAISYLDQSTLLKLAPYPLTEGERPLFQTSQTISAEQAALDKGTLAFVIIEKMRGIQQLDTYSANLDAQKEASTLLQEVTESSADHLTSQRIHSYQKALSSEKTSNFNLTTEEWQELLQDQDITATATIFEAPVYDPTFSILSWFSDPATADRLSHDAAEKIGIAFSQENMVVLVQEQEETEASTTDDIQQ
ncbi:CAP-associated domain-containing protein [Enterococcus sp.]|uniref:CAP-associated domain-containing protein n=1 Tax=Enterococcus sp. TaxID=35783 RepID=UPI0028A5BB40|nr:CAP-associated domain-containing protein [Enterococcus sp.]